MAEYTKTRLQISVSHDVDLNLKMLAKELDESVSGLACRVLTLLSNVPASHYNRALAILEEMTDAGGIVAEPPARYRARKR